VDDLRVTAAPRARGAAPTAVRPSIAARVLALAWPGLLQNWLILAVSLSDRLLAGRFQVLDAEAQAATQSAQTTAAYLAWFLSSYTALVSVGTTTLVAHFIGAGHRRGARLVANQALLLAVVLGLAGTLLGLLVLRPVLGLLHLEGAAADYAADYLRPLLLLFVFQTISAAGVAALAGAGDTRTGLWVLGGVAVLNLPLAWMFFHGVGPVPALGFAGIAVGTAVSQTLGGLAVLAVLWRGRAGLRLRLRLLRPRPDLLRRMLRVSIPATADSLSMAVGYLWFVSIVNELGDVAAAAHGVALTWEALGYQSGSAFGTAAIALVGQNLGAREPLGAARSGWTAFGMAATLMSLMGALFFTLAVPMFQLFCPHDNQADIVKTGVPVLQLVAFAMPGLAACMVLTWALRGAGDTRLPMVFTWLGFFAVRVPLAYLLTGERFGLGLFGAWLAMFIDIYVRGLFVLCRFAGGRWQEIRV
jgi:putative MATE family efflux protein